MSANAKDNVIALLALIQQAATDALLEYERYGQPVPSLDSTTSHPLDLLDDSVQLRKVVRILEGACTQLCATLAPPVTTVVTRAQNLDWVALRVVVQAKVPDVLHDHANGLHVNEISKIVGIDPGKLSQILRLLATEHIFRETDIDVFANNRLSTVLHSSSSMSSLVYCNTTLAQKAATIFYENITDPGTASSYEPGSSAFMQAASKEEGIKGVFYDWLKAHPDQRQHFSRAMGGLGHIQGSLAVIHQFPWESVSSVCDVGSGVGSFSLPLLKANLQIRVALLDKPEIMKQAKAHWEKEAPTLVTEGKVDFVSADFFAEVPVTGQDIYYLRNILHNWPESEASTILSNVRAAMGPNSRVLIHDYVLHHLHRSAPLTAGRDNAPEPLVPNYGGGVIRAHYQDLRMLFVYNARERTLDELVKLGSTAGLQLMRVWDLADTCVLEMQAVD